MGPGIINHEWVRDDMAKGPWCGKVAVVCGGSSGLGLELARRLIHQEVAWMAILGRDAARLQRATAELKRLAGEGTVEAKQVDLLDREALTAFAQTVTASPSLPSRRTDQKSSTAPANEAASLPHPAAASRHFDLVIQAVGRSDRGTIEGLSDARLKELLDANVITSLHAIQAFAPHMAPGGKIVLVGSLASLFATRFLGGYAIAKHALAALAAQARRELADRDIHVMLACPGPIRRDDAGQRYRDLPQAQELPEQALQPGGGARLRGLDPQRLASDILDAAARNRPLLIRPRKAAWLWKLSAIVPSLAEAIIRRKTA